MATSRSEQLVNKIVSMDRKDLIDTLRHMQLSFQVDFTDEFLASVSMERLQHIVLAASLHANAPVDRVPVTGSR